MKSFFLFLISAYKRQISPYLRPSCRYIPTCSEYAYTAIERFGALKGGFLALKRILRCHPLHKGGYDPVPDHITCAFHAKEHGPMTMEDK